MTDSEIADRFKEGWTVARLAESLDMPVYRIESALRCELIRRTEPVHVGPPRQPMALPQDEWAHFPSPYEYPTTPTTTT